jgi:magnesium transporter
MRRSGCPRAQRSTRSLVAQRIYRIKPSRTARWEIPEDDANERRKGEGDNHNIRIQNKRDAPLRDRFRRRLPWLLFGLAASSLVIFVMTGFEQTISANAAVAFFVPALVYIAGTIGTQAVSVAVRGFSRDTVSIGKLLRDEIFIGAATGAYLGVISTVAVFYVFGNWALASAVGLAVLGGGTLSAIVGFGLPWIFQRLGSDPALGSGPICTIIQDAASLSIYFVLVTVLMN